MAKGIPKNGINKGWFKKGRKLSDKEKKEKSESLKRQWNSGKRKGGWKMSEKAKRKISQNNARYFLGKHHTDETKKKMSEATKGKKRPQVSEDKSSNWKGDAVGYFAVHCWIVKWKGKPNVCEMCGTTTAKKFEWANIDHKYRRVLEDYIRVCTKCHRKYDNNKNTKNENIQLEKTK